MSVAISNLATTWTNSGTTYTGIKLNVTDTASAAGSLLMDLQVGGTSQFSVRKNGNCRVGFQLNIAGSVVVGSSLVFNESLQDTSLARDAAQTLAQRNGTNAQVFRVYNTFTDASNYERGKIEWASNVLRIGTEKAGTGTTRELEFQTDGTTRLTIGTTGNSIFGGDLRVDGTGGLQVLSGPISAVGANARFELKEVLAPAAPSANGVRIYAEDNGAGKTRLMALFATGAAVQIAIEP